MDINKEKLRIRIEEDEAGTTFEEMESAPVDIQNIDADCCEVAKEVFRKAVIKHLSVVGTIRQKEILDDLITIENLSCEDFLRMLVELRKVSGGSNIVTTVTKIIGKYIRLEKVPTSMFSNLAHIVKQSSAEALQAWEKCNAQKMKREAEQHESGKRWQDTLHRSKDLKFQTWDNTLLSKMKCPVCKEGTFKVSTYKKPVTWKGNPKATPKATLKCDNPDCGYEERFV